MAYSSWHEHPLGPPLSGARKARIDKMRMNTDGLTAASEGPAAAAGPDRAFKGSARSPLSLLFRSLFALSLLVPAVLLSASPVAAAHTIATTTTCGNALGVDLGGRGLICDITIVNTVTPTGGSAVVTVHECFGSAGSPIDGSGIGGFACDDTTTSLTQPVTTVNQCNGSINGGGGVLRCSVIVTTNFTGGVSPGATAATVNECVGSGAGGTVGANFHCTPYPATTDSASITQCNGSANGLTLTSPVGLTCTATGTMASGLAVTITQCNGSNNGGGALVVCSANMVNNAVAAPASGSLAPASGSPAPSSPAPSTTRATTPAPSSTASDTPDSNPMPFLPLMILLAVGGLVLATVVTQRRSLRN
jgi:hypothetical protein